MFHQLKILDKQCSFLRFLWCNEKIMNTEIIDYKMTDKIFGGSLSPSCSHFVQRKAYLNYLNECWGSHLIFYLSEGVLIHGGEGTHLSRSTH